MATRTDSEVTLAQAWGINNPFVKDWKAGFFTDGKKRVASIPFMRNLIEYTIGETDTDYATLTSLLHWKADSAGIDQSRLDAIYVTLFGIVGSFPGDGKTSVVDFIQQEAQACLTAAGGVNFEHKIVLSIAIRLTAEKFMANKIADPAFIDAISENQTQKLLKRFKEIFPNENDAIRTLQTVVLMTPENIHLNAFMYEPILDMSDDHLKKLYSEVRNLK
jgi:hypothetical protein